MNTLYVNYLRPHRELESLAERFPTYVNERCTLETAALQIRRKLAAGGSSNQGNESGDQRADELGKLLGVVAELRDTLFGFRPEDVYDFVVHLRSGAFLRVFARRHHPTIRPHDRAWKVGEGYVGRAAEDIENIIVSENLQQWAGWHSEYESDETNYRSAICIPMNRLAAPRDGQAGAVLTITSNRLGHFKSDKEVEALTARSLASIISLTGALDG